MNHRSALAALICASVMLAITGEPAGASPPVPHPRAPQSMRTSRQVPPPDGARQKQALRHGTTTAAARKPDTSGHAAHAGAALLLTADVIGDAELAGERGGTETHNQNTATGAVAGNVASQLTTGSNSISSNAFANTSGIPIVIQNTGNNVLIQNSTILNLQLTNPQ